MTMRLLFWVLMLLWLIIGVGGPVYFGGTNHLYLGGSLLLFILLGLLGWRVFGQPVEG